MPPTIGATMRVMTSEPVPVPRRMGSRPAITTATVIAFGRTRSTAPSLMAASRVASSSGAPLASRCRHAFCRYTSITTPNSAATPARAMKPTAVATEIAWPSAQTSQKPPTSENGTAAITSAASPADRNSTYSRTKTMASVSGTTTFSRSVARSRYSN